jgi:type III pantothenate kinase
MLLCIDIGNTHIHFGLVQPGGLSIAQGQGELPTKDVAKLGAAIAAITAIRPTTSAPTAIALCSVVPAATPLALNALAPLGLSVWQINHRSQLGAPIHYPRPVEIGQDRLANTAGAVALGPPPVIVIDLGTAVTFDIITKRGGYEGGIITPGPALMTRYLHEHTAQLPLVEDVITPVTSAIGKSTVEAMRIGAVLGFVGSIQACLDRVLEELTAAGEPNARILTSGGASAVVAGRLRQPTEDFPDLTLRGLAAAWALNPPTAVLPSHHT